MTTIVAIASPPGPARRGILRLSGPASRELVNRALVSPGAGIARGAARGVVDGTLDDGRGLQPVRVLWMPAPRSYTREDVVELHLPGSPPLLACACERMLALGAEPAAPGEFTRRAFLNGRLDLTQVEGVLALVEAADDAERRAATRLLEGGLDARVTSLRDGLDELRALCEASLDFDEADTGNVPLAELVARTDGLHVELERALAWEVRRQPPSALPRVLLSGAPNAGKSSLFNALSTDGHALVDELAGTTRDRLEATWPVAGAECLLVDAPGDLPAAQGADLAAERLARGERGLADLVLWVVDASCADVTNLTHEREALAGATQVLLVWNKLDLPGAPARPPRELAGVAWAGTSARTGLGLDELARAAAERLGLGAARSGGPEGGGLSRELFLRHRRSLEEAFRALAEARTLLVDGTPLDLCAEALRSATRALDGIHGTTTAEDLLERIFARFCVGK